jgi:GTP cyclohydrolase I
VVESENFESIHNHSAYALIERDKDRGADVALVANNSDPL